MKIYIYHIIIRFGTLIVSPKQWTGYTSFGKVVPDACARSFNTYGGVNMCGSDRYPDADVLFSGYVHGVLFRLSDDIVLDGTFLRTKSNTHVFYQNALTRGLRPEVLSAVRLSLVENFSGNGKAVAERKRALDQNYI